MTAIPDVVIVGAGTAGAAAALHCARAGLATVCLDRRPLGEAGARWVNGVPAWAFDETDLPRPVRPELRGDGAPFHLVVGWGPDRLTVDRHGVLEVDMRALTDRLQRLATAAGATFVGDARVTGFDGADRLDTTAGPFRARLAFVDASGLGGAGLLPSPTIPRADICAAAQYVHDLADRDAANAFLARFGAAGGEAVCFTGVAGGYSIVNVRVHGDDVSILTGSIPALGHASGARLHADFVAAHPFVGPARFGGARPIPLARPHARLASARVALLGDAGSQVFPAHGSGIAAQLVGARLLADALSAGEGPLGYQRRWQRAWGGLFAAYGVFRRFSETLSPEDLGALVAAGLLDPDGARAGMAQRWPRPDLTHLARLARAAARYPGAARRLAPVLARMALAPAIYRAFPRDPARVPAWDRVASRVLDRPTA
ncbi:MAG: FAD-binding protein [Deltaproteobacteria bacterium]|nr:FAD-binding protein [Deltaproteobacteria bacterium]